MTPDAEELGRRMRALHMALRNPRARTHEQTVRAYEEALSEIYEAESVDVDTLGSWGWWARKVMG